MKEGTYFYYSLQRGHQSRILYNNLKVKTISTEIWSNYNFASSEWTEFCIHGCQSYGYPYLVCTWTIILKLFIKLHLRFKQTRGLQMNVTYLILFFTYNVYWNGESPRTINKCRSKKYFRWKLGDWSRRKLWGSRVYLYAFPSSRMLDKIKT
jgi:hypothetical protein